jgi:hypothetical protein
VLPPDVVPFKSANIGLRETKESMSDQTPQSFKKHARFDPPFHMILFAVLVVNLIICLDFTGLSMPSGSYSWGSRRSSPSCAFAPIRSKFRTASFALKSGFVSRP